VVGNPEAKVLNPHPAVVAAGVSAICACAPPPNTRPPDTNGIAKAAALKIAIIRIVVLLQSPAEPARPPPGGKKPRPSNSIPASSFRRRMSERNGAVNVLATFRPSAPASCQAAREQKIFSN
jgi:hypothetical protein